MARRPGKAAAAPVAADHREREIATALAGLDALDLDTLRSRWLKLTSRPAPRAFRRTLLVRAFAYELQVAEHGGLPPAVKRRLRQLALAAREGRFEETLGTAPLKPGTLLVRLWQGQTHRVMVLADGFAWDGVAYGSLSTIAKAITGTSWNGWAFFGLHRSNGRNKNAAKLKAVPESAHA